MIQLVLQLHFSKLFELLPCALIMSDICTRKGLKDNNRSKVMFLLEKVEVLDMGMRMLLSHGIMM
jgi:hypothetical protein